MAEEIPLAPPPVETPVPGVKPAPAPVLVDAGKARREAEYYARHPEQLEATLEHLERAGQLNIKAEVDELRQEIALRDIISEEGLTKDDIPFIKAGTREEMVAKAKALRARIGGAQPTQQSAQPETVIKVGSVKGGVAPVSQPPTPPAISEVVRGKGGIPSVEAARNQLLKDWEGVKYE